MQCWGHDQLLEVPVRRYVFINAKDRSLAIQPPQNPTINYVKVSPILYINATVLHIEVLQNDTDIQQFGVTRDILFWETRDFLVWETSNSPLKWYL